MWLLSVIDLQKEVPLDQDPAFKISEMELRLKRLDSTFTRLSNIQKQRDKKDAKDSKPFKKGKKFPGNFKMDNITFDSNNMNGMNWEDFVNVYGKDDEEPVVTDGEYVEAGKNNEETS